MNLEKYPLTDEEINIWNNFLNRNKIYPIELLVNKNNKNFINLQKIFKTLKLNRHVYGRNDTQRCTFS